MRKTGILLAISSLPSSYGIGDFGFEAYRFIDDLYKSKMKLWQILPLNPLGYGNSPYQPYSSIAMDELYISLDLLHKQKLINKPIPFNKDSNNVDYEKVRIYKQKYLEEAFANFKQDIAYKDFSKQQWVYNYAVFICFKKDNDFKQWNLWSTAQITWIKDHKYNLDKYEQDINFEIFKQYLLYEQWLKLKVYANKLNINIIGDIPFYVGFDSLDVYENSEAFLLDDCYYPAFIAGVPPDYFAIHGQRWGNPIYNWNYLEKTDFKFWIDRMNYNAKLFDIIRIDHFRAFDTYWKIPSSCETAEIGEWIKAPGYKLFDKLFEKNSDINIVAEDLGDITLGVRQLRDYYKFKGMKIIQFEFNPNEYNNKFNTDINSIIYTGTHDNSTVIGWFNSKDKKTQALIKKSMQKKHFEYKGLAFQFISYGMESDAEYAIFPMQDILSLDDQARMNFPGTIGYPNWAWKMTDFRKFEKKLHILKRLVIKYHR